MPSAVLAALGLALLLGLCPAPAPVDARGKELRSTACDACLFSWRMVDDVLSDPEVVQSVVSFVEARCPEIGGGDKCKNLAEGLLPVVLQWLASAEAAQQFCDPACHTHQLALQLAQKEDKAVEDGAQCAMCQLVVTEVQQVLNNSAVFDKLNATAQSACAQLPPDMAATCSAFVNKYEPLLQALIANAPAEELCELLGVCAGKLVARLSRAQLPFPDAQQRKRMPCAHKLARSVQMARLSAAPGLPRGTLGDSCDMCKMAVIEAHSLVTNPTVQQSIINYTASLCAQFQSFNDTCVLYVELYAPIVFSLLDQYLVPDSLCGQIGICPAKPPAVAATELTDATVTGSGGLGLQVVKAVASWVEHLREALGARVQADHAVTMEMANAAANTWASVADSAAAAAEKRRRV